MSAYADAQTPGGYGDTSTAAGTSGQSWWQTMVGNAVNRYMDVETWKATGGQMPPNYYVPPGGTKMQAINTGTQYTTNSTIAGVPVWALAVGAVALVLYLKK